ncbi:MAG: penicillin acylase family protein [Halieaceae bacterium]
MRAPLLLHSLLLLLCGLLSACSEDAAIDSEQASSAAVEPMVTAEELRQQLRAANVTIIRDDYGVPHIYGKTDADAVFGLLYAQSEDDFPRVERNYIWALGRLAEVEGESALFSDLRAHLYMTEIEARQAYKQAPDWLKQLCIAFADGINYYLRTHPQVAPALITHFEPWMPMYFFEGSIGGDIEQIPLAGIAAFYGKAGGTPASPAQRAANSEARLTPAGAEPAGSNGIAIAGALSESGHPLLLINPHTSFYFRGEVHVVSEEGLNAYGAVTWGQFFVYQGFNEHTGWMHTSTYVDFMDEFVEDIVDKDGHPHYRYGDKLRPLAVDDVTLRYRDGDGFSERSFPTYRSHHGPITHEIDGKWVATRINWDPVNALRQSFLRSKQANYEEFREMMQIRTNSSNNTVYADSSGNIAYFHGNFIPRRNPGIDFSLPVDGSDPATDWQGLHSVEETITLLNPANGWIQNCNSTPFSAAGRDSPRQEDYPAYMAPDPENFRGIHAARLLRDIADSGEDKISLNELIALAYHPALPAFQVLVPSLSNAWEELGSAHPELEPAIALLQDWNMTVALDSTAMTLAHFYGLAVLEQKPANSRLSRTAWIQQFAVESAPSLRLQLLAGVVEAVNSDFGRWDTPWAEVNRMQRLSGDINLRFDDAEPSLPVGMASGRWGALAAFGARAAPNTRRIYGYRGNSFVAVVEFGDKLRARSLLAGGQSNDPASPHFFDQGERYVNRQFKEVAFYRKDVEARAKKRYQPGQ